MGELQLVTAEVAGIFAETLIYGGYLIMFIACMYVLVGRELRKPKERRKSINKPLLGASLTLFVAITLHWGLNLTRASHALIRDVNKPLGSLGVYGDLADPLNVSKTGVYIVECLIADMIMVYRLWVIWNHNYFVCAIPACSVIGLLATGTGITYQFSQVTFGEDVFVTVCGKWITSSFSLTLCTNVYSTFMIAYKIWSVNRALDRSRASGTMNALVIIVESAALYTSISFASLVSYLLKSNFQFTTLEATSPTIGLTFCMIIVRVGLGIGQKQMISTLPLSSRSRPSAGQVASAASYPMAPIAVTVDQQVSVFTSDTFGARKSDRDGKDELSYRSYPEVD